MGNTAILSSLGALAIICWILSEVVGPLNPGIAGKIKLMGNLLAVSMVIDMIAKIYAHVQSFSKGLGG